MKLLFIDETSDTNEKTYLGLCCALIDATAYRNVKDGTQRVLRDFNWSSDAEFKGNIIFSETKGDTRVSVDDRVKIASRLLQLNKAKTNARIRFGFCDLKDANFKKDYLECLPILLLKIIPKAPKGSGKNLISVHYDEHPSLSNSEVRNAIKDVIQKKGYILLEDVVRSNSNFETPGIMFADITGYLLGRKELLSKDNKVKVLTLEQQKTDGRYRKLQASNDLLELVKSVEAFDVKYIND